MGLSFVFSLVSLFTMFFSGLWARVERDFKKIVAISTLRQLGFMIFTVFLGLWILSFVQMVVHAFFKRMLFLRTGSIMRKIGGGQDYRFFGGEKFILSSFICFIGSICCLVGFPFFVGFYAKDVILLIFEKVSGVFVYYLFIFCCVFTVIYGVRLFWVVSGSVAKGMVRQMGVDDFIFSIFIIILFFFSCLIGRVYYWVFLFGFFFGFFLVDLLLGVLILLFGYLAWCVLKFCLFYKSNFSLSVFIRWITTSSFSWIFSIMVYFKFDKGWVEFIGGFGVFKAFHITGRFLKFLDNNILGVILFMVFSWVFFSF